MEIKASQVKELRDMTGVAMMECKKALIEAEGDLEKAVDLLRSNSALKAEKKSSRVAADGILVSTLTNDYATILEINTETDFAAKDSSFLSFAEKVKKYITENKVTDISSLEDWQIIRYTASEMSELDIVPEDCTTEEEQNGICGFGIRP